MEFTGERYCPEVKGEIELEHSQRYALAKCLAAGKIVLDVASGEGYGSAMLAKTAALVFGLEFAQEAVDNSLQKYHTENLAYIRGNAIKLPFADASFDLVTSFETIEHVDDQDAMLAEIRRVLKPSGFLLLSSPDRAVNQDLHGKNPYHVRELYKYELEGLIGKYFSNYALWGQRMVFASVLEGDLNHQEWYKSDGIFPSQNLPAPKYFILLAGNAASLPKLPFSIMEGKLEDAEFCVNKVAKLEHLQKEHDNLRKDHLDLENAFHDLEDAHDNLTENYYGLREERNTQRTHIMVLESQINEMLNSKSWRLTAPLRSFMHRIRLLKKWFFFAPGRIKNGIKKKFARRSQAALKTSSILLVSGAAHTPGHIYRMERVQKALGKFFDVRILKLEELIDAPLPEARIIWLWRASPDDAVMGKLAVAHDAGVKIIFDVDDMCFHPDHFTIKNMDALRNLDYDMNLVRNDATRMLRLAQFADLRLGTTYPLACELFLWSGKPSLVLRNTFDHPYRQQCLEARSKFLQTKKDRIVRIGYAAGTRTHQADLGAVAAALVNVLKNQRRARLVLYESIDLEELPLLKEVQDQIEMRPLVTPQEVPGEMARFDINIVPLEIDNRFCNCKSELKYFETALMKIPTVASATMPFKNCIAQGKTGFLANSLQDWEDALSRLLEDEELRAQIGAAANRHALWFFGPEYLTHMINCIARYAFAEKEEKTDLFNILMQQENMDRETPCFSLSAYDVIYAENMPNSQISVIIPLYNYQQYVCEALDSLAAQTLETFDIIVVNDCSTDDSETVALNWLREHAGKFNSVALLRNKINSGLSIARNVGIDYSESEFVMLLDADNILLPDCLKQCRELLQTTTAAFAYPKLQTFGDEDKVFSDAPWEPVVLRHGNYIDAMAMIRKACWAAVGGYTVQRGGWEDYDFWCKFVERGFWGINTKDVQGRYRVHGQSMLHTTTDVAKNKAILKKQMNDRHNWLHFGEMQ